MNLSAENINKIRELVRIGYPLKACDAQDLLGHNDHLVDLLEARFRLMLGLEIERDQLKAECEGLREDAKRYRWLRSIGGKVWKDPAPGIPSVNVIYDIAVDAVMGKESGQ